MNILHQLLAGHTIESVHADSEMICMVLSNGRLVTFRGVLSTEPGPRHMADVRSQLDLAADPAPNLS